MPSGATKLGRSLSPGRRMEETQFYNEVVRPDGAIDGLVSVPFRHGRFFACLAIERIRGQPDFEESDARIIQFVLPHLTNATRIRLRLEQAELTTGLAYRAFDQLDLGVFVVDAELRPLHVNKFAEALLKEADGLSISQGKLKAMDLDRMRALQRAVKAAFALYDIRPLRQPSYDEIVNLAAPFELTRRTNSPTLTATVVPLSGENAQRFLAPPSRAVLFVKRSTDAPRADVGELQVRLGLSPRQAALTALLAQGMTLARAAESLGVATETARWHLREAFQKTYTHRQADLVRLALSGGKPAIDD